eukprot:gene2059-2337_t
MPNLRHDHEASHEVSGALCIVKQTEQQQDDLYNYQMSLLDLGMNLFNFFDAVSMGDGEERGALHCTWNRFSKTRQGLGGNIPLDLAMEHYNKMIKGVLRQLGPNVDNKDAADRYCKALAVNKKLIDMWDKNSQNYRPSGKHKYRSSQKDQKKLSVGVWKIKRCKNALEDL